MGLFDSLFGGGEGDKGITKQEAFTGILLAAAAADGHISEEEAQGLWTAIERMRRGEASVVHGDGTSLWTLTHSSDVARALVPLLGNAHAVGESVNLVSGDILTWDQIHTTLAQAAGVREPLLVHRSSESIGREIPGWGEVLQEDFRHSILFDTAKLRRLVPGFHPTVTFSEGARRIIAWHEEDASRRVFDDDLSDAFDRLIRNG